MLQLLIDYANPEAIEETIAYLPIDGGHHEPDDPLP